MATEELLLPSWLPGLLQEAGYDDIQTTSHTLDFSSGSEAWPDQWRNVMLITLQSQPMIREQGLATQDELDQLHARMLIDMH